MVGGGGGYSGSGGPPRVPVVRMVAPLPVNVVDSDVDTDSIVTPGVMLCLLSTGLCLERKDCHCR